MKDRRTACTNCRTSENFYKYRKGYCQRCYPLVKKINDIKNGAPQEYLRYNYLETRDDVKQLMREEHIRQIEARLEDIRDANIFMTSMREHNLELQIKGTLALCGLPKTLGKINDYLRFHMDEKARIVTYQLFAQIRILKPFRLDVARIYDVMIKNL